MAYQLRRFALDDELLLFEVLWLREDGTSVTFTPILYGAKTASAFGFFEGRIEIGSNIDIP